MKPLNSHFPRRIYSWKIWSSSKFIVPVKIHHFSLIFYSNDRHRHSGNDVVRLTASYFYFCHPSHCLSLVELRPSSSISTSFVVPLRGDWAIFRTGYWQNVMSHGKIPWNAVGNWIQATGRTECEIPCSPTELLWLNVIYLPANKS